MPDDTKPERSEKKNLYRVRFRFRDDDGTVWTVWDTFEGDVRPHTDPSATARMFVNAKGVRRSYAFLGESHMLDVEALERQSREASLVAEMPNTKNSTPW